MSPEFQQTLAGHKLADTPIGKDQFGYHDKEMVILMNRIDIAYGSRVYIRHIATRGGYLHSHPHDYPTGSKRKCYLIQRIEEIDTEMCIQNNR